MKKRDVIVIGAGIAGMTAAIYLKRFNIDVAIFEAEEVGGQLNKTKNLKNFPGFLENDGKILARNIYKQLKDLEIDCIYENVEEVVIGTKKIVKTKINEYECNQLIIATGRAPRQLKIEGEEKLLGHGVSYCAVCDGFFFKNMDVAVIGGSATAIENAIYLSKLVNKCYLICRKPFLKGEEINLRELESLNNIEIFYNSRVKKFLGDTVLTGLIIDADGEEKHIDISGAFVSIGYEPNFIIDSNIDLQNENGYLKVNSNGETNISGVFAIGDAIYKELYQLTTAVSEAAVAANYIKKNWYK